VKQNLPRSRFLHPQSKHLFYPLSNLRCVNKIDLRDDWPRILAKPNKNVS